MLSSVLRCSSNLQEIHSLENIVTMAIQGTQVSIYTNTHYVFFWFFNFFFIHEKKNKVKFEKQLNKNIKKHTKHKTRLTQNKKEKQTSYA